MISSNFLFCGIILDNVNLLLVFTAVYLDLLLLNKYPILENSLSGAADPAETEDKTSKTYKVGIQHCHVLWVIPKTPRILIILLL